MFYCSESSALLPRNILCLQGITTTTTVVYFSVTFFYFNNTSSWTQWNRIKREEAKREKDAGGGCVSRSWQVSAVLE
jgi:hypothetical protein